MKKKLGPQPLRTAASFFALCIGAQSAALAENVALQNATATLSQSSSLGATLLIDSVTNNSAGWAVFDFGRSGAFAETAVVETATDIGFPSGSRLTFGLYHVNHNPQHGLGRFRMSYTTDPRDVFADGLNSGGDVTANWVVLNPSAAVGTGGETITIEADGSILVSGPNPQTTVYSIVADISVTGITGFRIEALEDPSLPGSGPGRFPANGNFVLSEFTVDIAPRFDFPRILSQPTSISALLGESVTFSVDATGAPPLGYQWYFAEIALGYGTNATITLADVGFPNAGPYRVVINNSFGSVTSVVATLAVFGPPTNCAPDGLVGWWPFNSFAGDLTGGSAAVLFGNPAFVPAQAGDGLHFDGNDDSARIPASSSLDVGVGAGMTVELWIKPQNVSAQATLIEWSDTNSVLGAHLSTAKLASGDIYANLMGRGGEPHILQSPAHQLTAGEFQHIALTYDWESGLGRIYRNGVVIAETELGAIDIETRPDLHIGRRVLGEAPYRYAGVIDELSVYSRALSGEEVFAIFGAGAAGKCSQGAPTIISQPVSVGAETGDAVEFSVGAVGTLRLTYQWYFGAAAIDGGTNDTLSLPGVGLSDGGSYFVVVANSFGSVTSAVASLTVSLPPSDCLVDGLVGWWPLNSTAEDVVGGSAIIPVGNPSYTAAKVLTGLQFDGVDDHARISGSPALDVGVGAGLTVEMWIKPENVGSVMTLVEWSDTTSLLGAHMTTAFRGSGSIYANLISRSGQSRTFSSAPNHLIAGEFQHVALTYDKASGTARFVLNGVMIAEANLGSFDVETRPDLYVGRRVLGGSAYRFQGVMDELSVYSRALTTNEIRVIYEAGAAGKCSDASLAILSQPTNVPAVHGQPVQFSVFAVGSHPLSYQWYKGENAIAEGTNRILNLHSVTFGDAGNYQVVVGDSSGSVTSVVATLQVNYPSARVQVVNVDALAYGPVQVPVQLVANGNENVLSFSLNYDGVRLSFVSAELGAGAAGGTLVVNDTTATSGQLGLSVALPAGQTFAAGTQTVAMVTLTAGGVPEVQRLRVEFGDEPVVRQLSGVTAGVLPVVYDYGTISVSPTRVGASAVETVTGGSAALPISLLAVGSENAVSFSLGYNTAVLAFSTVQLGAGLPPDASILVNTSQAASGQVGISVALPAGATFSRGLHDLVHANFDVATVLNPVTTPVRFVNSPTIRQVANVNAQPLPAVYGTGSVSVVSVALEADIAPRPGGDQILSVIDWVQVGRFAAALDEVEPAEFQRADCAPRESRGNGLISVADWVQAGRYSAGLDPVTGIGGPIAPVEQGGGGGGGNGGGTECVVRISSTNVLPGSTVHVPVQVSAIGTENALGFSLVYDATKLRFVGVSKLGTIGAATLNVNTNQAGSGRVGLAFALPAGSALAAGSHDVLLVTLAAAPAVSGTTTVSFGDSPVVREAVTAMARTVSSSFASGEIVLGPPPVVGPAVSITRSSESVVIFWSAAEAGYELQTSEALRDQPWSNVSVAPIEIGGQKIVTLPRTGSQKYFRLRKP